MTRAWRDYDFFLIGCVMVLTGFSLTMVASITVPEYLSRHLINLSVGTVAMLLLTALDYHALQAWARPLYVLGVVVLGLVMLLGSVSGGAQSWLDLRIRTFQPSEPAKLLIIVALAAYWAHFEHNSGAWKIQLGGLILAGIPILLVFLQPDFGTAMVFVTIWAAMAWTAGLRWWHIVLLLSLAIPIAVYGWTNVLYDTQRARLLVFLDPVGIDPTLQNEAWDITKSLEAVQLGGITGLGWDQGEITQGGYIEGIYTDYIFAATSEELGFIGASVLILFQCILMWRALHIAQSARDMFGRLIAVGVTGLIFCHVLVHIGMNMSIMPVTGIPLPFISYGGSFTLTTLAAIGLLESVALRRRKIAFG